MRECSTVFGRLYNLIEQLEHAHRWYLSNEKEQDLLVRPKRREGMKLRESRLLPMTQIDRNTRCCPVYWKCTVTGIHARSSAPMREFLQVEVVSCKFSLYLFILFVPY